MPKGKDLFRRERRAFALLRSQALADLRAVAVKSSLPLPRAVGDLGEEAAETYRMAQREGRLPQTIDREQFREPLQLAMASPEEDPDGCVTAIASLLAETLNTFDQRDDWLWTWEACAPVIRQAAAPVRAAVMIGFRTANYLGIAHELIRPTDEDCQSLSSDTVLPPLIDLAKTIDPETRQHIASADSYSQVSEHDGPLAALLARPDCRLGEGEAYYPAEAVELCAYTPGIGFIESTALLLIWSIQDRSYAHGFLDSRWEKRCRTYLTLSEPWRTPVLRGFRYCYEQDHDDWMPSHLSERAAREAAEAWQPIPSLLDADF